MSAYPSFAQLADSVETWVDDLVLDTAVDGSVRARAFFAAKKRAFALKHRLTSSQIGTLQTHYDANRLAAFSMTWSGDNTVYTCLYEGPPELTYLGVGDATVTVRLREQ